MESLGLYFEKLLKILAGISFLFIAFGIFDAYSFFDHFHVPITNYISPSEIILLTINNSGFLFWSFLVQLIIWYWYFNPYFKNPDFKSKKYFTSKKWIIIIVTICIILLSLTPLLPEFYNIFYQINSFWLIAVVIIGGVLIFMGITPMLYETFKQEMKIPNPKTWTCLIIFSINIIMLIVCKNNVAFNTINREGNKKKIQIILNNKDTISQKGEIRYIGRTQDYFYYWDHTTLKTSIYPSSEVTQIIVDY